MTFRRLTTVVALTAVLLSSGCCWHRSHCCHRPMLFPRLHGCCRTSCCDTGCSSCCQSCEYGGTPVFAGEPSIAPLTPTPLPMPRAVTPGK